MPVPLSASRTQKVLSCRASPQPVLHGPSSTCIAEPQDSALFSRESLDVSGIQMSALLQCMECFLSLHCPATSVLLTADLLGVCAVSLPRSFTGINHIDLGIDLRYLQWGTASEWISIEFLYRWSQNSIFHHPVASFSSPIFHWLPGRIPWDAVC